MVKDYSLIVEKLESLYGAKNDPSKKSWQQLDIDYLNFSKKFLIGSNCNERSEFILNEIFHYDAFFEYITSLDDHKRNSGLIYKSWFQKFKKGELKPLRNPDGKEFRQFIQVKLGSDLEEYEYDVFKVFNLSFVYFLASLFVKEKHDFFDRDLQMISYLLLDEYRSDTYSKFHSDFLKHVFYKDQFEDAVSRYYTISHATDFFESLRRVVELFFTNDGEVLYGELVNMYGLELIPSCRRKELIFALSYRKKTNFYSEYVNLFKHISLKKQQSYAFISDQDVITLEKPFEEISSKLFQIFLEIEEKIKGTDSIREVKVFKKYKYIEVINDKIPLAKKIFKRLVFQFIANNSLLKTLLKYDSYSFYYLYTSYFLYKESIRTAESSIYDPLFREQNNEFHKKLRTDNPLFPHFFIGFYSNQELWERELNVFLGYPTENDILFETKLKGGPDKVRADLTPRKRAEDARKRAKSNYSKLDHHNKMNIDIRKEIDKIQSELSEILTGLVSN